MLGLHVGALQGWPVARRVDAGASAAATAPATLEVRAMRAPPDAPAVVAAAMAEPAVAVPAVAAALPPVAERPVPRRANADAGHERLPTPPAGPATPTLALPVVEAPPPSPAPQGEVGDAADAPRDADAAAAPVGAALRAPDGAAVAVAQVLAAGTPARPAVVAPSPDVPVYATRLPPPVRWAYRLRRGIVSGTAVLDWQRRDDGYRLSLDGSVAGVPLFEWVSTGRIDAHGIAPDRLVMRQVGSGARAANFRRDTGVITYSAREVEHPLWPGAQDRLSWLVQATGIVAAAPEKFSTPGAQIAYQVTGVRGDVAVWRLDAVGVQTVEVAGERVQAVLLRREPLKPFDTRGELWLDPQRHYLPVRLTLSTIGRAGEVVDSLTLELESTTVR